MCDFPMQLKNPLFWLDKVRERIATSDDACDIKQVGTTSGCLAAIRCSRSVASVADCMLQGIERRPRRPDEWDPPIEPYDPHGPGEDPVIEGGPNALAL